MAKSAPVFILVRPQMGENIGAAARAMLNFGVSDLRIVAPRDGWPNQAAIDNGAGAFDILKCQVFDTLSEAAHDLNYIFAATVRARYMAKPVFDGHGAAGETHARAKKKQKIGFAFGAERTGLTNNEVALCHAIMTLPTNPDFPSLNLGQSVAVTAYELYAGHSETPVRLAKHVPAENKKIEEAMKRLEEELAKGGFFETKEITPTMKRNIRAMFLRAEWSEQETRTFHGIISALIGKKKRK